MICKVEALGFRCLKYVKQDLDPFHVLVGPNASGKTTFLDAIGFLGNLVSDGLEDSLRKRTDNLEDMMWKREAKRFELAVELNIPKDQSDLLGGQKDFKGSSLFSVAEDFGK